MHRARQVAARCFAAAAALVGFVTGCTSQWEQFRIEWSAIRDGGGHPCTDIDDCRALLRRLEDVRERACGAADTCEDMQNTEVEIRAAIRKRFLEPCEEGDSRGCFHAHEFGYEDGLRVSCEMGLSQGCAAACGQGRGLAPSECAAIADQFEPLTSKCRFKRGDNAEACRKLGDLVRTMSASAPMLPPRLDVESMLYATPLLADRSRHRYALDYSSRACFLGDPVACRVLCARRPDEDKSVDRSTCRRILKGHTAKSLHAACREKDGRACRDLATLSERMGFFDRDPAGFFVSGPGRVTGLRALACRFGEKETCSETETW
jgi:hypothetical protein